ncbi:MULTISPECIES: hypothetical protein [Clostridia]|jgi:hypothetical protein|uniref:hypothetical protein n=1 Tax=Clostridia TaxID=186801 RepID=UPI0018A8E6D2|nr:hypothetical protein [Clostridium sp. 1001270J_160509_D11]
MDIDNEKLTIDGKEYTLANIKSIKLNNDNPYKNEDTSNKSISLTPEVLDNDIVHLNIQIEKIDNLDS